MTSFFLQLQNSPPFLQLSLFLFGLLAGSFLNVVIYRLPIMLEAQWANEISSNLDARAKSPQYNLAVPRSSCPKCGNQISWYENIPVISYLFLKGKCSHCHAPISIRYPLVELATGILYVAAAHQFGFSLNLLLTIIFIGIMVSLTMIDIDHLLLPDAITLPFLWIGLLMNSIFPLAGFVGLQESIWGAALGYVLFFGINFYYEAFLNKTGLGGGDAKLMAALGAWFGVHTLLFQIIPVASGFALVWSAVAILTSRATKDTPLPFGPSICIAGSLTCLFGYFVGGFLPLP
ncbi:prepilin peptidase [Polynucleobacter sp. JS-Safj-400b-B2]|uniref:prepilin peptidase n=1 Tax=Polynucleobacter sp. JS-Safj-400b-B2 TaxID=2576921 RepID=UPI001C0D1A87|nr:A24 family peptidase [Polynucleobacter sp. JS-Safj-400b-B2]MBU3625979.1 prepilin peptidase [Polynucleobacter sp. JS-Safj-400b-B2]